jgi:hypothetical protein
MLPDRLWWSFAVTSLAWADRGKNLLGDFIDLGCGKWFRSRWELENNETWSQSVIFEEEQSSVSAPQLHRCPGTAHPPRCVCHGGNVSCREELIRITPQAAPLVQRSCMRCWWVSRVWVFWISLPWLENFIFVYMSLPDLNKPTNLIWLSPPTLCAMETSSTALRSRNYFMNVDPKDW